VILDLCLKKTQSGKSHKYRDAIGFEKFPVKNVFRPCNDTKLAFSNCSYLKSVLEKLCLGSVDGGLNPKNNAAFSNLSGIAYTGPKFVYYTELQSEDFIPSSSSLKTMSPSGLSETNRCLQKKSSHKTRLLLLDSWNVYRLRRPEHARSL